MKAQELVGKTADELKTSLLTLRKEQFAMRMQFVSGQLANPSLLSKTRKDIARIKTAQNGGLTASKTGTATPLAKPKKAVASNKPIPQMKTTASTSTKPAAKKPAAKKAAKE